MPIANEVAKNRRLRNVRPALAVFLGALAAFLLAAYPIYVIRPFREQKPAALSQALWVLLHNKPLVLLLTLAIVACALALWRRSGWIAKAVLGEDPLAELSGVSEYLARMARRPTVQRVNEDRKADLPSFYAHLRQLFAGGA